MSDPQTVLDDLAGDAPVADLAESFLAFERPPGNDPVLLVAEAAASTTGQSYVDGIHPTLERFRETFVETDRVDSLADLADLDPEDEDLVEAFGAQRKRTVLQAIAAEIASTDEDDLPALTDWAATADHYAYKDDPIGAISGVGPATFQYLRILAGIPVAKPDPQLEALVTEVGETLESGPLVDATGLYAIAAAEWLSLETSYTMLEIDQLAWWRHTDPEERDAALEVV